MRVVVQRVSSGSVVIPDENYRQSISHGLVILVGIKDGDTEADALFLADKCAALRIFEDENGKMNINLKDVQGEVLIVSQFTLYGDAQKGTRPSFSTAARPEAAIPLYELFIKRFHEHIGTEKVKTGIFGAMMTVNIANDGPVTIIIESKS
ncbi:MAG: D-aminoacyl-tRNA deacylase [Ignavibacteria bacterium]|nr:D-aminoacyl-tRNA deacylase [Ignavibacteria bacterium]